MSDDQKGERMGQVIQIDGGRIRDHLGEMVRGTVEEALNALLDAEADRLCGAARYERTESRQDTRAGSYDRSLHTKAGEVKLKVPKLRRQTFETAIIERYRRRESSVEEALMEMYLAGVTGYGVEPQQEDLRQDRGMAPAADRWRASLPVPGWDRHEGNPAADEGCRRLSRRAELPQPGRGQVEAHRGNSMVHPQVYEHGSALRGANLNQRSRRLTKCAKDSGHYQDNCYFLLGLSEVIPPEVRGNPRQDIGADCKPIRHN